MKVHLISYYMPASRGELERNVIYCATPPRIGRRITTDIGLTTCRRCLVIAGGAIVKRLAEVRK